MSACLLFRELKKRGIKGREYRYYTMFTRMLELCGSNSPK